MSDADLISELAALADPRDLLKALHSRYGSRMAVGTGGQLTGPVIIALCVEAGFTPRVFVNDTGRLFPETLDLFDRLEKKYRLTIERHRPDPQALASLVAAHGEYLFFDSKEKQELCCRVRKVLPNERALDTLDVWVTGLRADQSGARRGTPRLHWIDREEAGKKRSVLKVAPLVDWTEAQLRAYASSHDVPVNALLDHHLPGGWRYESLGCILCTTPIGPDEPRRAGRWRWFNQDLAKECGIHLPSPQPPPQGFGDRPASPEGPKHRPSSEDRPRTGSAAPEAPEALKGRHPGGATAPPPSLFPSQAGPATDAPED